jgi:catechol 2,3-dioxygenase-like lactoylglutathione lyase family enzyme
MKPDKAHVSINVSDLDRAVAFYRVFLAVEPAKHYKDYAKFELEEPPLVLSLEPIYHRAADSFNHLGLRLRDPAAVIDVQGRLERAGVLSEREDDVECCYSRQTRFWLIDPDKNMWEVYALTGELPHRGSLTASDALAARDRTGHVAAWDHRLGDPIASPLLLADASVEEVRLRGTFNAPMSADERGRVLGEAFRVLAPGGQIMIHGLATDRALAGGFPRLPGPAALVKHTPLESEPARWLVEAGFRGVYLQKLGELPNFEHDGMKMREIMVVGWKPEAAQGDGQTVVYRGPFAAAIDDEGRRYPRGERVVVDAATQAKLLRGPLADQLVFLRDRVRS